MAYHGYLPLIKQHIANCKNEPALLEVGVDRGVTFLTMATFLARACEKFLAIGVDVLVQEQVSIMLNNLDRAPSQQAFLVQGNSLEVLPKLVEQGLTFDVLLLDGDHNYYTVAKELEHLEKLVRPSGLVIIDDYNGRWASRDLWYADRDGYEGVKDVTKKVDTEKHGVRTAVDEWLSQNASWQLSQPIQGEPVVLSRK